jgi:hypothetical protein
MKIGEGMIRADEESAPNQRANATQPDMQPIDLEGRHSTLALCESLPKIADRRSGSPRFAPVSYQWFLKPLNLRWGLQCKELQLVGRGKNSSLALSLRCRGRAWDRRPAVRERSVAGRTDIHIRA